MIEFPLSDEFRQDTMKNAAKIGEKEARSILKKLPVYFKVNDVLIQMTEEEVRILVAKHIGKDDASSIIAILGLALLYASACESEDMDEFQKDIPSENRDHINLLIDVLRTSEIFPILYYRFSRAEGYLQSPVSARSLTLETKQNGLSVPFFELMFRRAYQDGEVETIRLEMDTYEIEALISDLKALLE